MSRIERHFFEQDTEDVAEDLVGSRLMTHLDDGYGVRVTETGAYRGEPSRMADGFYYEPGIIHVYVSYGANVLTVSTEDSETPAVVAFRGGKELDSDDPLEFDGPGKLSDHMNVERSYDGFGIDGHRLRLERDGSEEWRKEFLGPEERDMTENCLGHYQIKI